MNEKFKTDMKKLVERMEDLNKKVAVLTNGEEVMSDIELAIVQIRGLIARCKRMKGNSDIDEHKILAGQVFLERALGELHSVSAIYMGGK